MPDTTHPSAAPAADPRAAPYEQTGAPVASSSPDLTAVAAAVSGDFLYRWAGCRTRADSPSVFDLVAAGWEPVAHDTRYGSTLCRKRLLG